MRNPITTLLALALLVFAFNNVVLAEGRWISNSENTCKVWSEIIPRKAVVRINDQGRKLSLAIQGSDGKAVGRQEVPIIPNGEIAIFFGNEAVTIESRSTPYGTTPGAKTTDKKFQCWEIPLDGTDKK